MYSKVSINEGTMVSRKVKVKNRAGIHCRPSSCIMLKASEYPRCDFKISCANGESDLSSILSLISLGLQWGNEATVTASGEDEAAACEAMAQLLEFEFDFPQK